MCYKLIIFEESTSIIKHVMRKRIVEINIIKNTNILFQRIDRYLFIYL